MKNFKTILAFALALALVFSLSIPAFAADETIPATDEQYQPTVHISKDLQIAKGTTTPNATFTFTFTPDTKNSVGLVGEETCPAIAPKSLTFNDKMTDTNGDGYITLVTDDILDDATFTHAGVYAYTVKETANTYTYVDADIETMTYDTTEYTLRIYVENVDGGEVVIKGGTVQSEDGKETLTKDDIITDGEDSQDVGVRTNGFRFVNNYTKLAGGKDAAAIGIDKIVEGKLGNKETQYFTYTLNVVKAENDPATSYTLVLCKLDENNDIIETKQTFAFGEDVTFELKHGENAYVTNLASGATFTLVETGTKNYIPTAFVWSGIETDEGKELSAPAGESLVIGETLVGENGSYANFTNTYDDVAVPPTGISINNLPFLMLISVSALGLFVLFVSKKRRAEEA